MFYLNNFCSNLSQSSLKITAFKCINTPNYYYYYIHLTAFFQDNLGEPAPER